ncbi:phosphogluconate dehydrogenase (NAD(+)-dependent, decarboxylating) [Dysgonomonas sp. 25]|uniref:phosphogluconate dehydrogenase (NAD(+)-dependent, decarboxylating) n=1 Tax=Dysgonomonas sp. 25 TaxID=2302933 RepID=UPI0013CF9B7E|nr:decarboxylating 6-phosphogluconate dehydrogenase [Dysgonomonas sp. 25]NDV69005.1 decarboxylating 6-phosphogluconate dehydrogenase [Dysgonomonas sp. 25]
MKIGFVGLGKMGGNMVKRLLLAGHQVVVYNLTQPEIDDAVSSGAVPAKDLKDLVGKLDGRKLVWLMVPAGKPVEENIAQLVTLLSKDDIIVDGGNSYWRETVERGKKVAEKGIHYLDCGTSGGVWGLQNGYCLMYGGNKNACDFAEPIFKSLAPENGYMYCGESGAGHMVKMVHNGIEYGMMQAYAEGYEIMKNSPYNVDLEKISRVWMNGSVVRSWLLELIGNALEGNENLDGIKDYVADSGEGRWTVQTAIDFDVPAHVITASLFTRFESRQESSFAMKLLAAMRNQFGGHAIKKE